MNGALSTVIILIFNRLTTSTIWLLISRPRHFLFELWLNKLITIETTQCNKSLSRLSVRYSSLVDISRKYHLRCIIYSPSGIASIMAASDACQQGSPDSGPKYPPATPVYVLRGHASPIHSLNFYGSNSRLISGDADGWVVVWDLTSKRAVATWKAHEGSILGLTGVEVGLETAVERRIVT